MVKTRVKDELFGRFLAFDMQYHIMAPLVAVPLLLWGKGQQVYLGIFAFVCLLLAVNTMAAYNSNVWHDLAVVANIEKAIFGRILYLQLRANRVAGTYGSVPNDANAASYSLMQNYF